MGKFPVDTENRAKHISGNAFQHIARSVTTLSASGAEITRKSITAILAYTRFAAQRRRHRTPYLPNMERPEKYSKRMQPAGKDMMPGRRKNMPAMRYAEQAE